MTNAAIKVAQTLIEAQGKAFPGKYFRFLLSHAKISDYVAQ